MRTRPPRPGRALVPALVLVAVVGGCGTGSVPPETPGAPATPPVTPVPDVVLACPDLAFDPTASLGPELAHDVFVRDESKAIAGTFIDVLARIYAGGPGADPCGMFTARGLRTAMETDPRLRDAVLGRITIESDLLLRIASEGDYDLRVNPPTVPLSIVFDIPAGARTTDVRSGTTTSSPADQRAGLAVTFGFDGRRWWADRVGHIEGDNAAWLSMPAPLPPGEPCVGLTPDPAGTPFDEGSGTDFLFAPPRPGRAWCDAAGRGRVIDEAQLVLVTRYPCNRGRAAVLTLGLPLGMPIDPLALHEYVRDPAGEFLALGWIAAPFDPQATLPSDAASSGWTNGNAELWISPSEIEDAVYVLVGDATERWPRAADGWGFIDCN